MSTFYQDPGKKCKHGKKDKVSDEDNFIYQIV